MGKLVFGYLLLLSVITSCSVEKFSLSPVGESFAGQGFTSTDYSNDKRKKFIIYSSEITNLIASFPKFRNDAVNTEVTLLKESLKDYISAMENYNINGMEISKRKFEKSYKKLQHLRKYLNEDEDQVLNRYLVRIKTNTGLMENEAQKETSNSKN